MRRGLLIVGVLLVLDTVTGEPIEGALVELDPRPDPSEVPVRLRVAPAPTGLDGRTSFVVDHPGVACACIRAGKPGEGYQVNAGCGSRGQWAVGSAGCEAAFPSVARAGRFGDERVSGQRGATSSLPTAFLDAGQPESA